MIYCLISTHTGEALRSNDSIVVFASRESAEAMATAMQLDYTPVSMEQFDHQIKVLAEVMTILNRLNISVTSIKSILDGSGTVDFDQKYANPYGKPVI